MRYGSRAALVRESNWFDFDGTARNRLAGGNASW
jgi:hypothetical protein